MIIMLYTKLLLCFMPKINQGMTKYVFYWQVSFLLSYERNSAEKTRDVPLLHHLRDPNPHSVMD